jgi:F-type H+-transporting ATPase subunit b
MMTGGSETWTWIFKLVNFGVLVALLAKFAVKPLKSFLVTRHDTVKARVEEAERARREADALKKEYEEKLAKLDDEIAEFKQSILEKTEREKNRILKDAERQALRIKEQAVLTYEQESRDALNKIKAEIAKVTIERAETLVKERVTREDHDRMVDDFIEKLRSLN